MNEGERGNDEEHRNDEQEAVMGGSVAGVGAKKFSPLRRRESVSTKEKGEIREGVAG